MLSRIYRCCPFITALPRCFPKASAKVMQVFELANKLESFFVKKREKINYALKAAQLYQILAKTIKNPPFYKGLFVCKSFTAERKSCRRLLYCCPAKVCTFSLQTKLSCLFLRKNEKFFILIKNGAFFKVAHGGKGEKVFS